MSTTLAGTAKINYLGVVVAAGAAFVASSLWYSPLLFGTLYLRLRGADPGPMAPAEIVVELVRTLVVAYVFARLVAWLGVRDWRRALRFGLWVWIGFPTMILLGSVAHENVPLALAAIHAGDWLVKVLILAVVPVRFQNESCSVGVTAAMTSGPSFSHELTRGDTA